MDRKYIRRALHFHRPAKKTCKIGIYTDRADAFFRNSLMVRKASKSDENFIARVVSAVDSAESTMKALGKQFVAIA